MYANTTNFSSNLGAKLCEVRNMLQFNLPQTDFVASMKCDCVRCLLSFGPYMLKEAADKGERDSDIERGRERHRQRERRDQL